ncbi:MAG: CBS domain-containing protein [Firmicutes bacterium]|nr:CBS domain-containing protein [Bacillota bacterium]
MTKVCDIMSDRVISVEQSEPVSAAARLLKRHNIGSLPVVDGQGHLRGILTDRDIVLRCVAADGDPKDTAVSDVMSRGIVTTGPFDAVDECVRLMSEDQVRRLPVTDQGRLVGIVALCDLARSMDCEMEAAEALTEISSNMKKK